MSGKQPISKGNPLLKWTPMDFCIAALITLFGFYCFKLTVPSDNSVKNFSILKDGKAVSTLSLDGDRLINLSQFGANMMVEVKNKQVRVLSSDCKQQICVHQGWIKGSNEAVFCLPNKITLEMQGGDGKYDAISR